MKYSTSQKYQAEKVSFRFDFLGSGESDGNFVDMTFQDELSCARVILEECLKMENCTEIYVLGHSMGGAIASELAKLYPDVIKKMVLWAPAFNLPDALHYLTGQVERAETYDHGGYEISDDFVEDILKRDFYQELDTYQNDLLVIHGTKDTTVPYEISNKYMKLFHKGTKFVSIEDGNHNAWHPDGAAGQKCRKPGRRPSRRCRLRPW